MSHYMVLGNLHVYGIINYILNLCLLIFVVSKRRLIFTFLKKRMIIVYVDDLSITFNFNAEGYSPTQEDIPNQRSWIAITLQ
jgi:hypothetical protein